MTANFTSSSAYDNPSFTVTQACELGDLRFAKTNERNSYKSALKNGLPNRNGYLPHNGVVGNHLVDSKTIEKLTLWESFKIALKEHHENETALMIGLQVFLPFFVAGFGMVGAGLLLDKIQDWKVFQEVSEMMILIPALLGLKGNLEMTSASRLSTMVNLGSIDLKKPKNVVANLCLVQTQAAVVGLLASVFASLLGLAKAQTFSWPNTVVLCASSLSTSAISSLLLDSALVGVIFLSFKYKINPDNVATPLAASCGDLVTLALLAGTGTTFNDNKEIHIWMAYIAILVFLLLIPFWVFVCIKTDYVRPVLKHGWPPIIISMLLSSLSGFVLDTFYKQFHNIAAFQPVMNGVGGNLAAIQSSRVATHLHDAAEPGTLVEPFPDLVPNVIRVFFQQENTHARTARVLLAFVIPGFLVFISVIYAAKRSEVSFTLPFVSLYLVAGFLQVSFLLYICIALTNLLWLNKRNPDSWAIPILTALGDLVGTCLLAVVFVVLFRLNDSNALVRGHD